MGGDGADFSRGVIATSLFGVFRSTFVAALALAYFVPLVLRASNDVSTWSLAASVRGLKSREEEGGLDARTLARESAYTLATAAVIAGAGLGFGLSWTDDARQAIAGAAGLFAAVALAGVTGLAAPLLFRSMRSGPAVVSGRVVGIMVTSVSVASFLAVAGLVTGAW